MAVVTRHAIFRAVNDGPRETSSPMEAFGTMNSPRTIHDQYRETATLKDGSEVVFRLIRPDDKGMLARGLQRMSPESRYRRFFSHRDHLSDAELAYLTELDHDRHLAIGVGYEDDRGGLGVARFIRLEDPTIAEAAIAVVDEAQGRGLGRMLFERLVRAAAERGVRVFRFEVLAENDSMLGLIRGIFPEAKASVDDGIMTIDCPLPDLTTHVAGERPDGLLYRVMQLAAQGAIRIMRMRPQASLLKTFSPPDLHDLASAIALSDGDGPAPVLTRPAPRPARSEAPDGE
jgi:GNAT superfamily N-acetyltransferase